MYIYTYIHTFEYQHNLLQKLINLEDKIHSFWIKVVTMPDINSLWKTAMKYPLVVLSFTMMLIQNDTFPSSTPSEIDVRLEVRKWWYSLKVTFRPWRSMV